MTEDNNCPICWHGHMDYDDESCVSCGCDWVFIRDRYDEGMKQRLAAAMFPELKIAAMSRVTGDAGLPLGEPAMHRHDGLGTHRAETHHRSEDYR